MGIQDGADEDDGQCPHDDLWIVHAHFKIHAGTIAAQSSRCA